MFGFLNIYKPVGKTSHDIVGILRRITKIKQIGHTGTLDPFAEGVLPICIGKATRLIEYLNDDKAYIGTVQFGASTTTYDREGEIVNKSDKKLKESDIEKELQAFRGEIEQYPPIYSAIKVNGKKLYDYARNGEKVEIKPRKVFIKELKLLNFNEELQQVELLIECSKGTYIRSIANDLGDLTKSYAHLTKLVRIKAGNFEIEQAVMLDELQSIEDVRKRLINPMDFINYPKVEINDIEYNKVLNGNPISINASDGLTVLTYNKNLIAIAEIKENLAKIKKVFIQTHI